MASTLTQFMLPAGVLAGGLVAPPVAGPGARSSGLRRKSAGRVLGPPETPGQISAVVAADLKRRWRLMRNRRAHGA